MLSDLRYAIRSLLKTPGLAAIVLLTLALGIGAVTTVFSALSSVLLRPLPYPNSERLVVPFSVNPQRGIDTPHIGFADYQDWQREKVFERFAVFEDLGRTLALSDKTGEPERVRMITVSPDYFAVLGIRKALLGRTFSPEEYRREVNFLHPCILSYELWKRRYRSDQRIVGRSINVDSYPCPVVGVMPPEALWPADIDIVQPISGSMIDAFAASPDARKSDFLLPHGIARLKPESSVEQINAVLAAIAKRMELNYPEQRKGWSNRAVPLHEVIVGRQARTSLVLSIAAVCCLLAIAVINVAGLLLARATARRQEMQVRAALGASRWQLTRYLLAESAVLALPGGALGLLLSILTVHLLSTSSLPGLPPSLPVQLDFSVFVFAFGASILSTVFCSLAPLSYALRRQLNPESGHGGIKGMRMLNGLIVAEITLSVLLLAGAGLLIRSFMEIQRNDPGFQSERLLTFNVDIPLQTETGSVQLPPRDREQTLTIYSDLIARLENAPGVLSAAVSSALPLGGGGEYFTSFFQSENSSQSASGSAQPAMMNVVGTGFFNTLGVRGIAGRDFDSRDISGGRPVVIVNEAFARSAFPNESPLGKRIRCGWEQEYRQIIGVVGNVRYLGREDELRALAYVPHTQWSYPTMMLSVRTLGAPAAALSLVRGYIQKIHPELVVTEAKTMAAILDRSIAPRRSGTTLLAVLAGAAMLLAAIGLYGVLTYTVAQRVKEIGIRMALGARTGSLIGMIVGRGLRLTLMGVVFGLAGAFLLSRLIAHLLYEVSATDPITFIAIALLLTAVALATCYLPARRASRVDPLVALRAE
jgi:putative ABC transport system permease protein